MMNSNLFPLLSFIAVIVMIPVALWLFKRTPLGASLSGASTAGALRAVGMLSLSATQKLLLVEVGQGAGRRWLVLGVTPNNITVLHSMEPLGDEDQDSAAAQPPAPGRRNTPFEEFLGRLRQTNKGEDGNVH